MDPITRKYLLSLESSKLSNEQVEDIFQVVTLLDEHNSPQPQTAKGKRVTVEFSLNLLKEHHAHKMQAVC